MHWGWGGAYWASFFRFPLNKPLSLLFTILSLIGLLGEDVAKPSLFMTAGPRL